MRHAGRAVGILAGAGEHAKGRRRVDGEHGHEEAFEGGKGRKEGDEDGQVGEEELLGSGQSHGGGGQEEAWSWAGQGIVGRGMMSVCSRGTATVCFVISCACSCVVVLLCEIDGSKVLCEPRQLESFQE